ncbi:hypothetical protein [Vibrio mediterranei]|uniref:hypothetical protein n=1 Tax=Vibrio mediterranei TaxID=689 RepID=UPI001EFD003A|nr:hypothetical protein [Vibrio mediterranei]MCG9660780.1 hypothetical protein [Vibrio mediterranei]
MKIQPNVSVQASLTPQKSQIVLICFLLSGLFVLCIGLFFLYEKVELWYVPSVIGVCIITFSGVAWFKSQKDTDLAGSTTSISRAEDRIEITTDARFANSKDGILLLNKVIEVDLNRQPLPQADGMIDKYGEVIPDTEAVANEQVSEINALTQNRADKVCELTGMQQQDLNYLSEGTMPNDDSIPVAALNSNQTL